MQFIVQTGLDYLATSRKALATYLHADADDLVYVINPSHAVNIVAKSLSLKPGDEVIVHHNVFRVFRDVRGIEKNSKSYISDNLYSVASDQIFAYKRNGQWRAVKGFCFVKPIVSKTQFSEHKEREAIGVVKFACDEFETGALVGFKPGSEYEFNIEEQRVYRVPINLITIQYEYQGDEEEYNPSWTQGC